MIKVYISSPYTLGNKEDNVKRQMEFANELMERGMSPFVPLLFHYQDIYFPRTYDEWLAFDLDWIDVCDCVLRLSGKSSGADVETKYAKEKGIPVFTSIEEVVEFALKLEGL